MNRLLLRNRIYSLTVDCPFYPRHIKNANFRVARTIIQRPFSFRTRIDFNIQHIRSCTSGSKMVSYLSQQDAQQVDVELMGEYAFSIDQLMELAGLSVASAAAEAFPIQKGINRNVLVVCGPGNNGGDGLVAARHLKHFGYQPTLLYPKRTDKQLYKNLVHQCTTLGISSIESIPDAQCLKDEFGFVIDAMFGFSFKGPPREPFASIIKILKESKTPQVAVDIPSGWDVEKGDVGGEGLMPEVLVSLTAPKLCSQHFKGRHYVGGRFVPPALAKKYNFSIPNYPGTSACVELK